MSELAVVFYVLVVGLAVFWSVTALLRDSE